MRKKSLDVEEWMKIIKTRSIDTSAFPEISLLKLADKKDERMFG